MTPQDRAEAFIGRLVKAIRMPRLPNPVHKMPQGTGLGVITPSSKGPIGPVRQRAVNARATMDSRSSGQGAEPVHGVPPSSGAIPSGKQSRTNEIATRNVGEQHIDDNPGGYHPSNLKFPKNPKRRAPEY